MIHRREFLKMVGTAVPAIALPAASSAERAALKSGARPNVLLIIAEDYGLHAGCYGDIQAHTPNLDQWQIAMQDSIRDAASAAQPPAR